MPLGLGSTPLEQLLAFPAILFPDDGVTSKRLKFIISRVRRRTVRFIDRECASEDGSDLGAGGELVHKLSAGGLMVVQPISLLVHYPTILFHLNQ